MTSMSCFHFLWASLNLMDYFVVKANYSVFTFIQLNDVLQTAFM
jgi:hypothetical protein